jgi:peptidoglycan/xylan/chitin deacetylase (PgdA/CDA1 family)
MYQQIQYTSIRQLPKLLENVSDRTLKLLISLLYLLGLRLWRGLLAALGRPGKPRPLVVLTYHNIKASQRRRFERQMRLIGRRYEPVTADSCGSGPGGRGRVAVTFDDGFRELIDNALPITAAHGIPVTIFVVAGYLGSRPGWITDRHKVNAEKLLLSPEELRRLAGTARCLIGSHTLTHRHLPQLDSAAVRGEVAQSRARLEGIIGRPVQLLSFPFGEWRESIAQICREEGYRRVFANTPQAARAGGEPFVLGRVAASPEDSWLEFRLKLAGGYQWGYAGIWLKGRLLALLGRGRKTTPIAPSPDRLNNEVNR